MQFQVFYMRRIMAAQQSHVIVEPALLADTIFAPTHAEALRLAQAGNPHLERHIAVQPHDPGAYSRVSVYEHT